MRLEPDSTKPLYIQIAESIEDEILDGILTEGERAYSQYQVAEHMGINPATAGKGIKLLEQEGILFKKRGLGMFVTEGAAEVIKKKRVNSFMSVAVKALLIEAHKLGINKSDIKAMIDAMEVE